MNFHETQKTAILFFSRTPEQECREKVFLRKNRKKNRQIARIFYESSLRSVQQSGLSFYLFDENKQTGSSFGERLSNAFLEVFEKGYDSVIAVGNDSPGLMSVRWPSVVQHLKKGNAVLGPTKRDGSYLIALSRKAFDKDQFTALPWQKQELLEALGCYLNQHSKSVVYLTRYVDINHAGDLYSFIQLQLTGRQKHLVGILKQKLSTDSPYLVFHYLQDQAILMPANMRAPPASLPA